MSSITLNKAEFHKLYSCINVVIFLSWQMLLLFAKSQENHTTFGTSVNTAQIVGVSAYTSVLGRHILNIKHVHLFSFQSLYRLLFLYNSYLFFSYGNLMNIAIKNTWTELFFHQHVDFDLYIHCKEKKNDCVLRHCH